MKCDNNENKEINIKKKSISNLDFLESNSVVPSFIKKNSNDLERTFITNNRFETNLNNSIYSYNNDLSSTTFIDRDRTHEFLNNQMKRQFTKRPPINKTQNVSSNIDLESVKKEEIQKKELDDETCRCDSKCLIF